MLITIFSLFKVAKTNSFGTKASTNALVPKGMSDMAVSQEPEIWKNTHIVDFPDLQGRLMNGNTT